MTLDRARLSLLIAIALAGVAVIVLSLLPWVEFHSLGGGPPIQGDIFARWVSFSIEGTETSRMRDLEVINQGYVKDEDGWCSCRVSFGDGYITAVLGGFIAMTAAVAVAARRDRPLPALVTAAALLVFILAGFNAIVDWQALAWTKTGFTEAVEGDIAPALWALVALSALTAILGTIWWSLAMIYGETETPNDLDYLDDHDDHETEAESLNSWA